MIQYESAPGFLHFGGKRFFCRCGNGDFKVEIGSSPTRFWCVCGVPYTEETVDALGQERREVALSGE